MEIPDGLFGAGEFIDIEDGMLLLHTGCIKVVPDNFLGWHGIFCVEQFCATRRVKDESIVVDVMGDLP